MRSMTIRIIARSGLRTAGSTGTTFGPSRRDFGKTVHEDFPEVKSGEKEGVIRERNKWVAADGTVVCTDERTLRFYNPGGAQRASVRLRHHACSPRTAI